MVSFISKTHKTKQWFAYICVCHYMEKKLKRMATSWLLPLRNVTGWSWLKRNFHLYCFDVWECIYGEGPLWGSLFCTVYAVKSYIIKKAKMRYFGAMRPPSLLRMSLQLVLWLLALLFHLPTPVCIFTNQTGQVWGGLAICL